MINCYAESLAEYDHQLSTLTKCSQFKNGHVVSIARTFQTTQPKVPNLFQYFQNKLDVNVHIDDLGAVWAEYKHLQKNAGPQNRQGNHHMMVFLDREFYYHPDGSTTELPHPVASNTSENVSQRTMRALHLYNSKLLSEAVSLRKINRRLSTTLIRVQRTNNKYSKRWYRSHKKIARLKDENKSLKRKNRSFNSHLHRLNQREDRKRQSIRDEYDHQRLVIRERVEYLESQLKIYDSQICELQGEMEELKKPVEQKIETRVNGRYIDSIRQSVYICARRQVPIASISTVIAEIGRNIFGRQLSPLPSSSTVGNMVQEMGVLALEQAVQAIMNSKYVNLCWDATLIDSRHINEVHVNTDHGSYILSVQRIAGGTTQDYVDHIVSALEQAADVYSKMKALEYDTVLSEIKKRITSTLSDRAAVNHCVSASLSEYVGHDILDLNCNIHPLDSLSIAYRKLAKSFEVENEVESVLPGTESAFVKVIQNISSMRYKSKGDPIGLSSYLQMANLDRKLLKRYVGNRFHILFELSGNIFYMRKQLCTYLDSVCAKDDQWREAIRQDLSLSTVEQELVVCGLFGKVLTGPWMACIYRKAGLSNLDTCTPLGYLVGKLSSLIDNPRLLWDKDFCCFELTNPKKSDLSNTVHEVLCSAHPDETSLELARQAARDFLKVVEKQAERYLPGGELAELEPEMIVLGTNAPADNVMAESILGLADHIMRKCRNVTDSYLQSKTSFSVNKTYDWLLAMRTEDRIPKAIMQGRAFRSKQISNTKATQLEISERLKSRSKNRETLKRRKLMVKAQSFIREPDSFKESVHSVDSSISDSCIEVALEFIEIPSLLEGRDLVWNVKGKDLPLNYRVLERMSDNSIKYQALCWSSNETIDDSSDTEFFFHEFIAGLLLDDIWLI